MSPLGTAIARQAGDEAFRAVARQIDFAKSILPPEELLALVFRVGIGLTCDGIASAIATALGGDAPCSPEEIADEMIARADSMLREARDQVITLARLGARTAAGDAGTGAAA